MSIGERDESPLADVAASAREDAVAPLYLENWLPYRLFKVAARVANLLEAYYRPRYGLTRASWRTLGAIGTMPGLSPGQISRLTGLDAFAVSRSITHLRELGLADRTASEHDRRYASIDLTDAGKATYLDLSRLTNRIEQFFLQSIAPEDYPALDRALTCLDEASATLEEQGWRRLMGLDDDPTETRKPGREPGPSQ